ncbi:MAG: hypothetical protein HFJ10_03295 [Lachnospiraceae bacterium]|nr:hypothetical protein [Lachnospiraceae bacterium]
MDKYGFQIKTEQIEKLVKRRDYGAAAKIADSIDWRKIHNVELLMKVSEIYENLERYDESFEILNLAYESAPIGRMVVYKMVEVAVKMGDCDEAVELYKEFIRIAPHDLARYVLKYEIYKGRGSSIEDQIAVLEEYKSREYQERWAYELATLYYRQGMLSKCVEECDDLILWFSEGEYVVKAMELKRRIQPLTASQEEKYRQMATPDIQEEIIVKPVNVDEFNTSNLQAALAEGLQDFIRDENDQEINSELIPPSPIPEQEEEMEQEDWEEEPPVQQEEEIEEWPEEPEWPEPVKEETEQKQPELEQQNSGQSIPASIEKEPEESETLEALHPLIEAVLTRDTLPLPKFLGQDESGQLTFDMEENILDRQITGQMTIADILNGWEEKKKETEVAIEEAAKRDEERRKKIEYLRATGKLPNLSEEFMPTLPEDIQRLIDEIEGKIPVKVHVEPILRSSNEDKTVQNRSDSSKTKTSVREKGYRVPGEEVENTISIKDDLPDDIIDILEAPIDKEENEGQAELEFLEGIEDLVDILEAKTLEKKPDSQKDTYPDELDEIEESEEAEEIDEFEELEDSEDEIEEVEEENVPEAVVSTLPSGQLSEEQKKLFAYFTSVRGMSQQLAELLEEDRMRGERRDDSLLGNIVITGERGSGKTTLAADIVKAVQKQRGVKGGQMAKVEANSLNGKNIFAVLEKLGGGTLLIEKAGNLKTETAVKLSHAMTRKTGGLLVILEDEKEEIQDLFIRCESLGAKFTQTIDIPTFTNKELVAFGESYALEQECVLDEMAVLALYNRIGNNQTSDHLVNVAEVKDMIDDAIDRGGKKGLFGKVKKSRMDEFGNTILLEKDFEV